MLVISRRKGQRVMIGEDIEIVVTEVHRSCVKLGIVAPRGMTVLRGEVRESIEAANREAAQTTADLPDDFGASPEAPSQVLDVAVLRRRSPGKGSDR